MSDLLCNNCINSRLACLKHQREQQERELQQKYEQEALEHAARLAELESQSIHDYRRQVKAETESFSKELEKKFQEKRKTAQIPSPLPPGPDYLSQFAEARKKYRDELLTQISEKQSRAQQEKMNEVQQERRKLEEIEAQKQKMMEELVRETAIQRENYKFALMQQTNLKKSKRTEEEYEKHLEKIHLDEQVRRHTEEQRKFVMMMKKGICGDEQVEGVSACSGCNRVFPGQALNRFP